MDERTETALINWGAWCRQEVGSGGYGVNVLARLQGLGAWRSDSPFEARIPVQSLDAIETDAFVRSLATDLRATCKVVYVTHPGHLRERQARELGIERNALSKRLDRIGLLHHAWVAETVERRNSR